jgi:hypothetical protein
VNFSRFAKNFLKFFLFLPIFYIARERFGWPISGHEGKTSGVFVSEAVYSFLSSLKMKNPQGFSSFFFMKT